MRKDRGSEKRVQEPLKEFLKGWEKVCVIGIGNELRGEDGIGCKLARKLEKLKSEKIKIINAETVPENFVNVAEGGYSHIILIDSMYTGEYEVKCLKDLEYTPTITSTHKLPLKLFVDYLKKNCNARIMLVGIGIKDLTRMSKEVIALSENIFSALKAALKG